VRSRMYTPAEEVGLSGLRLATRVQHALDHIPPGELVELMRTIRRTATDRHLAYQRDGVTETIRLLPCPFTLRPDQLGYTHYVSETVLNCIKRLPDLYFDIPEVREILRVTPIEEEWLRDCWTPMHREANPVFARLDAVVDYTTALWKDSIKFMEPNLSGVGGLHIGPTSMGLLADLVVPALLAQDPSIRLQLADDIRELLLQELLEHLQAGGRPDGQIVLVDPKYAGDGPDEPEALVEYYRERHGLSVLHADVSELRLRGDEVWYDDRRVDLAYRDASVLDLMDLADEGVDVAPMRALLRQNRVVSSISAELDQKSCFEVFTDPELARRFLTVEECQVMRRHVLWTRLVSDRRTGSPAGDRVDLLEYVRNERESLVLKPNRSYGGEGVLVGPTTTQSEWESAIDRVLVDDDRWVVQQVAPIPVKSFHILDESDRLQVEPFYIVMGFAPTRFGVALVTRASQRPVVNVAQQGGMCAVMVSAKALAPSR
jgi:DNA-binding transcriptional MerR regulator